MSILFPLIAGLFFYRRNGKFQTYFLWFIIYSFAFESVSTILSLSNISNHWMFKPFFICDFLFFTWFFYQYRTFPKWLIALTCFYLGLILFDSTNSWFLHTSLYPSSLYFIVLFLYFIILSFYILFTLLDDWSPTQNPILWIAAARLIYYLFVIIIYAYSSISFFNFKISLFADTFAIINGVANVLCNIMFGISFLCKRVQV